ncbi:hypothetical protein G8770_15575 [Aestuariicella hydrocarbonica]|uniref:PEP-CTERM protein-sorting domain-containing protein n=1 Tax=Pseudomaricurvus hydrocarbonicus TaxID=1470433 RepID=A0A9E5JXV3_9GAMM|nr:hypothetical protein [Aestuariicella hydrocarbonica]NHO66970.1 hypothetical protein [Aestuariicella hydrocarbonica]
MKIFKEKVLAGVAALFLVMSFQSQAALEGYNSCSGATSCLIAPEDTALPTSISANPDDGKLVSWNEQQNVTLENNLYIDNVADPTASYIGKDANGTYIKAGTVISSHYVQWDGIKGTEGQLVKAQLDFDGDVMGFISSDSGLAATDSLLGLGGLEYLDFEFRGLESNDKIKFGVGGDASIVDIAWKAYTPGDWARVITAYTPLIASAADLAPVSVPSTLFLFSVGLLGLRLRNGWSTPA